ncbi:Syntaxin-1A [Papilio xuthus]|uniref:Syntaxin-1A n=1 Tax=Papilio xuthus TaxID=66420 RepID=A0A194QJ14_PAPXU|nr:Syntaxin-1A [Papilio xuthus]
MPCEGGKGSPREIQTRPARFAISLAQLQIYSRELTLACCLTQGCTSSAQRYRLCTCNPKTSRSGSTQTARVAGPAESGAPAPVLELPRDIADLLQEEQLDAAVTRAHAAGLKLCGALRQLAGRAGEAVGAAGAAGAACRMARLQYACARRRCAAALAEHAQLLQLLRDDRARLLHEQIKLIRAVRGGDVAETVGCWLLAAECGVTTCVQVRAQTAEARRALRDAEARRGELARAEAALREVRDLFVQLSHLVAQQQEQIDSVEYFALQASEHVESGGQELLRGSVGRRRARKHEGLYAGTTPRGTTPHHATRHHTTRHHATRHHATQAPTIHRADGGERRPMNRNHYC